jgi:NAD(P)-dependent dehydrogenase (short-subunit alcohol dehydrogenase family)
MSSNPEVLAQAEHLKGKVVAVTCATSPLGEALCEHAAKAGASVFALDSDPTALAQQSISFRQNKLRLRPMPCDFTSQESILNAVQEIVSHAPPIDFWIHAEALAPAYLLCTSSVCISICGAKESFYSWERTRNLMI